MDTIKELREKLDKKEVTSEDLFKKAEKQAKGKNIANPLAQILSVAMLLEHFNLQAEAQLVRHAVTASLDANVRTPEIQVEGGAHYGTKEVGKWIVEWIKQH